MSYSKPEKFYKANTVSLFLVLLCAPTMQAWIMTGLFLINPYKWVCTHIEIDVIALMMSLISQQLLQPSLNHWAWMIMSILHLEHLSQWASLEAMGVLMISYLLIKACLCLIYQSGSLSKTREMEKLILTDSLWWIHDILLRIALIK